MDKIFYIIVPITGIGVRPDMVRPGAESQPELLAGVHIKMGSQADGRRRHFHGHNRVSWISLHNILRITGPFDKHITGGRRSHYFLYMFRIIFTRPFYITIVWFGRHIQLQTKVGIRVHQELGLQGFFLIRHLVGGD